MDWLFVIIIFVIFLAFYMYNTQQSQFKSHFVSGRDKAHFVSTRDWSYTPQTTVDLNNELGGIVAHTAKDPQQYIDRLPPGRRYMGQGYGVDEVIARQQEIREAVEPSQIPTFDAFQRAVNGFGGKKQPPNMSPGAKRNLTMDSLKFKEYDVRQAINNMNPVQFTPNYETSMRTNLPTCGLNNGYALDRNAQILTPGVQLMIPGDPQQFNIDKTAPYAVEAARQRRTATALPWTRPDVGNYFDDFIMQDPWWNSTADIQQLL